MREWKFFVLFLFLSSLVVAEDINTCRDLNVSTTYDLTSNVSSTGTCFTFSANDTVLDCHGFTIFHSSSSISTVGVYLSSDFNITVRDCIIVQNSSIYGTRGISSSHSDYLTVDNCSIFEYGESSEGIYIANGDYQGIYNSSVYCQQGTGVYVLASSYGSYVGNNLTVGGDGLWLKGLTNENSVYQNIIVSTGGYAVRTQLYDSHYPEDNVIYNNLLNGSSLPLLLGGGSLDFYNTSKVVGSRVYSSGVYVGGNFYTNSTGGGYSDTCVDSDTDGFCDSSYELDANNIDYLPLSLSFLSPSFSIGLSSPSDELNSTSLLSNFTFVVSGNKPSYSCELFINDTGYGTSTIDDDTEDVSAYSGDCRNAIGTLTAQNAYDESWGTYAEAYAADLSTCYIFENTSLPRGVYRADLVYMVRSPYDEPNVSVNFWNYSSSGFELLSAYSPTSATTYTTAVPSDALSSVLVLETVLFSAEVSVPPFGDMVRTSSRYYESLVRWIDVSNNTEYDLITNTSLSDGLYSWYVNCTANSYVTNTSAVQEFSIDTVDPMSSIIMWDNVSNPYTNDSWVTSGYVRINLSCSDATAGCDNITYCTDTVNSCSPNTNYTSTIEVSDENVTYLRYYSIDNFGNTEDLDFAIVKIDKADPSISFVSPSTNSSNLTQSFISVNVSALDSNEVENITIYLYDDDGGLNSSYLCEASICFYNFTSLLDGNYFFNATVFDVAGKSISTETREVNLDNVAPSLTLTNPVNGGTYSGILQILTSISDATTNISSARYKVVNNTGSLIVNGTLSYPTFDTTWNTSAYSGTFNLTVNATDWAGNVNSTSVSFTLDQSSPTVQIFNPSNESYHTENISANFYCSDDNLDTCKYNITDSLGNLVQSNSSSGGASVTFTDALSFGDSVVWPDGTYTITVWANDSGGGNVSTFFVVYIDNTAPVLSGDSVNPITGVVGTSFDVDLVVVEANLASLPVLEISIPGIGDLNYSFTYVSGNTYRKTYSPLVEGVYSFNSYVVDLAGNAAYKAYTATFTASGAGGGSGGGGDSESSPQTFEVTPRMLWENGSDTPEPAVLFHKGRKDYTLVSLADVDLGVTIYVVGGKVDLPSGREVDTASFLRVVPEGEVSLVAGDSKAVAVSLYMPSDVNKQKTYTAQIHFITTQKTEVVDVAMAWGEQDVGALAFLDEVQFSSMINTGSEYEQLVEVTTGNILFIIACIVLIVVYVNYYSENKKTSKRRVRI